MYGESPATRDMSESVLPPMWASINSSREKRRVFPFTTRCAAALNVSWGTCPWVRTKEIYSGGDIPP